MKKFLRFSHDERLLAHGTRSAPSSFSFARIVIAVMNEKAASRDLAAAAVAAAPFPHTSRYRVPEASGHEEAVRRAFGSRPCAYARHIRATSSAGTDCACVEFSVEEILETY